MCVCITFILIFSQVLLSVFFSFFFSSRRRHTRSKRDWSSDVCSSDLASRGRRQDGAPTCSTSRGFGASLYSHVLLLQTTGVRSEERRVGKECRCRWSPYH